MNTSSMRNGVALHSTYRVACDEHQVEVAISRGLDPPYLDAGICLVMYRVIPYMYFLVFCINVPLAAYYFSLSKRVDLFKLSHKRNGVFSIRSPTRSRSNRGNSLIMRSLWLLGHGTGFYFGFPFSPNYLDDESMHPLFAVSAFTFGSATYILNSYLLLSSAQRLNSMIEIEGKNSGTKLIKIFGRSFSLTMADGLIVFFASFIFINIVTVAILLPRRNDQAWQDINLYALRITACFGAVIGSYLCLIFKYRAKVSKIVKQVVEKQNNTSNYSNTSCTSETKQIKSDGHKKFRQQYITELVFSFSGISIFSTIFVSSFVAYKTAIWSLVFIALIVALAQYALSYLDAWKIWRKRCKFNSKKERKKQVRVVPQQPPPIPVQIPVPNQNDPESSTTQTIAVTSSVQES